ncbi:MAG: hypothetical protein KDA78_06630 [Planctomycetaceae bacterium]|nr:hypothetical protein [Planctomycetaceae bacterium]
MRRCFSVTGLLLLALMTLGTTPLLAEDAAPPKAADNPLNQALKSLLSPKAATTEAEPAKPATHHQAETLTLRDDQGNNLQLRAITLDADGRLLVACGGTRVFRKESIEGPSVTEITQPGEIRVFDRQLKPAGVWSIDMEPQAIFVSDDGSIYVAGYETILKLNENGEVQAKGTLPHVADMEQNIDKVREGLEAQLKSMSESIKQYVDQQKEMVAKLKAKPEAERTAIEKSQIQAAEQMVEAYSEYLVTDQASLDKKVLAALGTKRSIASLAATNDYIFVATNDTEGHGFCVWRTDRNFKNGQKVVSGLVGCCGNMHIGAGDGKLYVAENARHRVCCYDQDGTLVRNWGERERNNDEGFASCCNPMNVYITKDGQVYTSESNVGRVKRFSASGEYQELIGSVDLVPGCKNVSIAVTPDQSRIYMMDMTRSHIIVMDRNEVPRVSAKD